MWINKNGCRNDVGGVHVTLLSLSFDSTRELEMRLPDIKSISTERLKTKTVWKKNPQHQPSYPPPVWRWWERHLRIKLPMLHAMKKRIFSNLWWTICTYQIIKYHYHITSHHIISHHAIYLIDLCVHLSIGVTAVVHRTCMSRTLVATKSRTAFSTERAPPLPRRVHKACTNRYTRTRHIMPEHVYSIMRQGNQTHPHHNYNYNPSRVKAQTHITTTYNNPSCMKRQIHPWEHHKMYLILSKKKGACTHPPKYMI